MNNEISIRPWNEKMDLSEFYSLAKQKGFINNSNQKIMIDCFRNEKEWMAWILFKKEKPIGSVVAHSFDDVMGEKSFRILARTCVLDGVVGSGLTTAKKAIQQHQNITDQYLFTKCLEWVGDRGRIYATSNTSKFASQKLVHNIYFPTLEKLGIVTKVKDVRYRYTDQTVWEIHKNKFFENLARYPRWL